MLITVKAAVKQSNSRDIYTIQFYIVLLMLPTIGKKNSLIDIEKHTIHDNTIYKDINLKMHNLVRKSSQTILLELLKGRGCALRNANWQIK